MLLSNRSSRTLGTTRGLYQPRYPRFRGVLDPVRLGSWQHCLGNQTTSRLFLGARSLAFRQITRRSRASAKWGTRTRASSDDSSFSRRSTTHSSTAWAMPIEMPKLLPLWQSPPRNTTAVGLVASPPLKTAVSSSSGPAGFAHVLHRPPVSAWVGCYPPIVLIWVGSLSFFSDFRDFHPHGPRMKIHYLSAPPERFGARVSAAVTTVDRRRGRGASLPATEKAFASVFAVPFEGGTGCRSPSRRDGCHPACSSSDEHFTGSRFRRDRRSGRPPLHHLADRRHRLPCRLRAAFPLGRAAEQPLPLTLRCLLLIMTA